MKEIRIHARAGQGAITAARILAMAAFQQGKYALAFPHFGAERMGAPMNAFVRMGSEKIRLRSRIHTPDYILVVDPSLALSEEFGVFDGLKDDGAAIINFKGEATEFASRTAAKVWTVPASEIAMEIIGQDRANMPILGGFAAATGELELPALEKAIVENFGEGKIATKNIEAVRRAYDLVAARGKS
ncbi:MAG: 2-oxoacid:acceptor oxidoreductase family protein [Chloroflexota bacterium]|jgi:pyruvate ferredoxin oxidoreductase gamma subunit